MSTALRPPVRIARRLTRLYILVLTVFGAFGLASGIAVQTYFAVPENGPMLLDLAGRQRMLSQRIALFAFRMRSTDTTSRSRHRSQLYADIERMRRAHELLTGEAGGGSFFSSTAPIASLYEGDDTGASSLIREFLAHAEAIAEAADRPLADDDGHLAFLVTAAHSDLLSSLDTVVQQYRRELETSAARRRNAEVALSLVGLVMVVLTGFFVFRPMVKRADLEHRQLAATERHLRAVLGNAPLMLFVLDREGNITLDEGRSRGGISATRDHPNALERYADHPELVATIQQALRGETVSVMSEIDGRMFETHFAPIREDTGELAGTIGVAVDTSERWEAQQLEARAHEAIAQQSMVSSMVTRMLSMLNTCEGIDEARRVLPGFFTLLFPTSRGAVHAIDSSRRLVEMIAQFGDWTAPAAFTPDECWALRTGRPHRSEGAGHVLRCRHLDPDSGPVTCVPMMARGESLGVLIVEPRGDDAREELLATEISEHLALGLSNLSLRDSLRALSIRDPLTGLFNRRYLEETLERELRRSARADEPLSVVVVDLDHFKALNDRHGHQAGDEALSSVGRILRSNLREADVACRYGGEEFVLVMPGASVDAATQRAESLRQKLRQLSLAYRDQPLGPITASFGVATTPPHATSAAALIRAADQAVYRAKHEGRDTVRIALEMAPSIAPSSAPPAPTDEPNARKALDPTGS